MDLTCPQDVTGRVVATASGDQHVAWMLQEHAPRDVLLLMPLNRKIIHTHTHTHIHTECIQKFPD
jgi:hypothetical protein